MAVVFIQEFPIEPNGDRSTTNYDAVNARLTMGEQAPAGLLIHTAGFDEEAGVFRILNVWETQAQGQAYFDDHVMPAVNEVLGEGGGIPPARQGFYELHHTVAP
jgi:hypothetical protein